jgi:hypothetical protein
MIYTSSIFTQGTSAVAFESDYPLEVAKFYRVKVKALSKRLFMYVAPPIRRTLRCHHQRGTIAKLRRNNETSKEISDFFIQKAFHKPCGSQFLGLAGTVLSNHLHEIIWHFRYSGKNYVLITGR